MTSFVCRLKLLVEEIRRSLVPDVDELDQLRVGDVRSEFAVMISKSF